MKKILPVFIILLFIFNNYSFAQNNLFFENKNAFTISTSFEKLEGNNNIVLVSPFYSFDGNIDFGLNAGYSLKDPHNQIFNPLAYIHLFSDKSHKTPFNLAYGLGYKYVAYSIDVDKVNLDVSANFIEFYYLMYYSMHLENLIIQPQVDVNLFLGESKVSSNIADFNLPKGLEQSVTNVKIGLAFIYKQNNMDFHFIPTAFLDDEGKAFSIQVGFTF